MPAAEIGTLQDLFAWNDWGRDKLLALAAPLSPAQLDRPFDVGPGSLRAVLLHLYGAERVWWERWHGDSPAAFPRSGELETLDGLAEAWRALAARRNRELAELGAGLAREISYRSMEGVPWVSRLDDILLHVCNHGPHHRAQALNILRRLGVRVPGLDYLFMRSERPTIVFEAPAAALLAQSGITVNPPTPGGPLSIELARRSFASADWSRGRVDEAVRGLGGEQLDRPFDIGLGSLRRTLLHIYDAEHWWLENWQCAAGAPARGFEKLPDTLPLAELWGRFDLLAAERDVFLATLTDEDLQRPVRVEVRPGMVLTFRLGESLLQLPGHGTHHRAQAVNMLRQFGVETAWLDWIVMTRRPGVGNRETFQH